MKIILSPRYSYEIGQIAKFIALDSKARANAFVDGVERACYGVADMPYKCRKSLNFNDESVRDLVFKGYVIPYRIESDKIRILGIYKENQWQP